MSHEYYSGLYGHGKPSWFKMGTVVPDGITMEDVKKHVLIPEILKLPLFYSTKPHGGTFADLRKSKNWSETTLVQLASLFPNGELYPLAVRTDNYEPVQWDDALEIAEHLRGRFDMEIGSVAVLRKGALGAISCKLPDDWMKHKERLERWIVLLIENTGEMKFRAKPWWNRCECANMWAACSSAGTSEYAVEHKGDVDAKLRRMIEDLDDCVTALKEDTVTFEKMMDFRLENKTAAAILAHLFGTPKADGEKGRDAAGTAIRRVVDIMERENKHGLSRLGTAWNLFNGVTYEVDHGVESAARAHSATLGAGNKRKNECLSILRQVVNGEKVEFIEELVELTPDSPEVQALGEGNMRDLLKAPVKSNRN